MNFSRLHYQMSKSAKETFDHIFQGKYARIQPKKTNNSDLTQNNIKKQKKQKKQQIIDLASDSSSESSNEYTNNEETSDEESEDSSEYEFSSGIEEIHPRKRPWINRTTTRELNIL